MTMHFLFSVYAHTHRFTHLAQSFIHPASGLSLYHFYHTDLMLSQNVLTGSLIRSNHIVESLSQKPFCQSDIQQPQLLGGSVLFSSSFGKTIFLTTFIESRPFRLTANVKLSSTLNCYECMATTPE